MVREQMTPGQIELLKLIAGIDEDAIAEEVAKLLVAGKIGEEMIRGTALGLRDEDEAVNQGAWNLCQSLADLEEGWTEEQSERAGITPEIMEIGKNIRNEADTLQEQLARLFLRDPGAQSGESWMIFTDTLVDEHDPAAMVQKVLDSEDDEAILGAQILIAHSQFRIEDFHSEDQKAAKFLSVMQDIAALVP